MVKIIDKSKDKYHFILVHNDENLISMYLNLGYDFATPEDCEVPLGRYEKGIYYYTTNVVMKIPKEKVEEIKKEALEMAKALLVSPSSRFVNDANSVEGIQGFDNSKGFPLPGFVDRRTNK